MLTEEQFIQAIYDASSPLVEEKTGSQEALDGYREYIEKRYSKTYAKISHKVDKLINSSLSKIAIAEKAHLSQMDFSQFAVAPKVEEKSQIVEEEPTMPQFDVIAEPEQIEQEVAEPDIYEPAEQIQEVVEETDEQLEQLHFDEPVLDTDNIIETMPEPVVVDTQDENTADDFDSIFDEDDQSPSDAFAQQVAPIAPVMMPEEKPAEVDDDLIDDDEFTDEDINAGNNSSIPDMAIYGIESESIDERVADSAMNRLVDTSNKAFKMACAVLDGKPAIDNELAYIQATDDLYEINSAIDEENKDVADTLVMETALDLMYAYGKSKTLSVRTQLYSNRNLDIEQRKAQIAARISQDTAKSLFVSLKNRISDPDLEEACTRYATAKVTEVFKRIDASNLDVVDDIRRMMMEREPSKFADKDEDRIVKYMLNYAGKHGC